MSKRLPRLFLFTTILFTFLFTPISLFNTVSVAYADTPQCQSILVNGSFDDTHEPWFRYDAIVSNGEATLGRKFRGIGQDVFQNFDEGAEVVAEIDYIIMGEPDRTKFEIKYTDTNNISIHEAYIPTSNTGTLVLNSSVPFAGDHRYSAYNGDLAYISFYAQAHRALMLVQEVRLFADCGAENIAPSAVASATPTLGDYPLDVSFDGSASGDDAGIVSWEWDFGNGDTATGEVVDYTYTEEGDFDAVLTVTDAEGLQDTDTVTIEVTRETFAPVADVVATPTSGDYPLTVAFNASGSTDDRTIVAYNWDFGDGNTGTGETVSHVYTEEGVFSAELTVIDDDNLFDQITVTITVDHPIIPPTADVSATPTSGDYPLDVAFDGSGSTDERDIVAWDWDFGDGNTGSGETVDHTYIEEGTYTAELTVTDDDGQIDTDTVEIVVTRPLFNPVAGASASPTSGDYPLDVAFDGSGSTDERSIVSWAWDFGDGSTGSGEMVNHIYTIEGVFTATLTVTDDDDLTDSATVVITVDRPLIAPTAAATATPATGTYPLDVAFDGSASSDERSIENWAWDFGDGATGSGETTNHIYTDEGVYTATLTVTDDDGLTDSTTVVITVERPLIDPTAVVSATPTNGIFPLDVVFDGSASTDERSIESWDWDFGDGNSNSGETVNHTYTSEGVYTATLTVTDDDGLTNSATVVITVDHPLIAPTALITSSAATGIVPHTVAFDGNGSTDERSIVSYEWDFGDGVTATGATAAHVYETVGVYSAELTVTDDDGLTDTASVEITVEAAPLLPPTADISASDTEGTAPLLLSLNGSGSTDSDGTIDSYDWDFGDGNTASGSSVTHTYVDAGVYTAQLTVTDSDNLTDTATIEITVNAPILTPTAVIAATPTEGTLPLVVDFNGIGSTDEDGTISAYDWDFGDGSTSSGVTASHTYTVEGVYSAELTVTDNDGLTDTATISITVAAPMITPTAQFNASVTSGIVPFDVDFDASGSSDDDGSIVSYDWDFGDGNIGSGANITHTFATSGTFTVALTVTDNDGLTDTVTQTISAEEDTTPCGELLLNGSFDEGTANWTRYGGNISGGQAVMGPGYGAVEQVVSATFAAGSLFSYAIDYTVVGPLSGARFQLQFIDDAGNGILFNYFPSSASGTYMVTEFAPEAGDPANSSYTGVTAGVRVYLEGQGDTVLTVDEVRVQRHQCNGQTSEVPTADFTIETIAGDLLGRTFDASISSDDGTIVSWDWAFGDGTTASGETVSHTYASEGGYEVELTVVDDFGLSASETKTVIIDNNISTCGELLQNGSFAAGSLYWQSFSAQVANGQALLGSVYGGIQQTVSGVFEAGELVTIEVDYTITGPTTGARFQLQFTDDAGNSIVKWYYPTETSGTFSFTDTVPEAFDPINSSYNGQTREIGIYLEGQNGTLLTVDAARVQYNVCTDGSQAPVASFDIAEGTPGDSLSVSFDASASTDADGSIVEYEWNMGDGSIVTGNPLAYTYAAEGTYSVVLTIMDDDGLLDRVTQDLYVEEETSGFTIIEIANSTGVSGYEIGIFGNAFGSRWEAGTVEILGSSAEIVEWSSDFVRAIVPDVADGGDPEGLLLTTSAGITATHPFTVYTIAQNWLTPPTTTFTNVSHGKPVAVTGVDAAQRICFDYRDNQVIDVTSFITDYQCKFGSGAKFAADSSLGTEATIAIDMQAPLAAGEYLFQFFSRPDWTYAAPGSCGATGYPLSYVLESSVDGTAGTWTTLETITDNGRGNRSHYIDIPAGAQHVRMRVIDSIADCDGNIPGRDFEMNFIELHQVNGSRNAAVNALSIYGDSLSYAAFSNQHGPNGLPARIMEQYPSAMPFTPVGLIGRKATGLMLDYEEPNELQDVYAEDAIASSSFYWGIALGTNDMNLPDPYGQGYTDPTSQFNMFDDELEANGVQWLIDRGHAPILARIPDTNEANNGFGFIEAKVKILRDIDHIAAKYQLIPGPDLYTEFRLNIERQESSWVGSDGTHHTVTGQDQVVEQWAEALRMALDSAAPEDRQIEVTRSKSAPTVVTLTSSQSSTTSPIILVAFLPLVIWSAYLLNVRREERLS